MTKKEINLEIPFLGLDEKPIGERTLGKELADVLAMSQSQDPLKTITWAMSLAKGEALSLDVSDVEKLKSMVKEMKTTTDLFRARVLMQLS
jgi:hypothetical protein